MRKAYGDVSEINPSWEKEVKRVSDINHLNNKHLVRFLAAFRRGQKDGYFMFEWASGENLTHLWHTFYRPRLTSRLVKEAIRQMAGLASAIHTLHAPRSSCSSIGNFNPDHLFLFRNDNDNDNILGTLKISGWELWRGPQGGISYNDDKAKGNWRYDAPEFNDPGVYFKWRSCDCDVWSMGCIMFEFLIWLMYGVDGLDMFRQETKFSFSRGGFFCQEMPEDQDGMPVFIVDPVVQEWMDHMAADPACEMGTTALGDLLELIRTRLLVIDLPQRRRLAISHSLVMSQSQQAVGRCMTAELDERMQIILEKSGSERYWLATEPKPLP